MKTFRTHVHYSSEQDCWLASAPGLFSGQIHATSKSKAQDDLEDSIRWWIQYLKDNKKPVPTRVDAPQP